MIDETTVDQATEQSMEERLASKFAHLDAQHAQEPASTDADLAELEWDGATYRVPAKLKDAFMRNEDYTRKTQALADERKTMEQLRELSQTRQMDAVFNESIEAERQEIAMIDAYMKQAKRVDLSQMDLMAIYRRNAELEELKERKEGLKAAIDEKRGAFNTQRQAKIAELKGKSREAASRSIQGFSEQTEAEVRKFALTEGLAEAEIDNVMLDPRSTKILWKAMQFDKVQAGTKKVDQTVKALKPGVAGERMPAERASKLNYQKAMKDAKTSAQKANVIEQRLSGIFR